MSGKAIDPNRIDAGLMFVDTNTLIYAYDLSAGEKHQRAKELVKQLWLEKKGCLSIQVLQEFYVNITHKTSKPLLPEIAASIVADLSTWKVYLPDADDVQKAIRIEQKYHLSFWDAMIIQTALAAHCHTLLSEDLSSTQTYEGLVVENPLLGINENN